MTAYRLDRILEWTQEFTHGKRKEMRRSVIYPLMLQLLRKMEWRTDMGADLLHDPGRALTHIFIEKNLDLAARNVVEPALQVLKIEPAIDRKSVVEGMSVSVRVDHGGHRRVKKK